MSAYADQEGDQPCAAMIDTFKPLMVTEAAMGIDDGVYWKSWLE